MVYSPHQRDAWTCGTQGLGGWVVGEVHTGILLENLKTETT